MYGAVTIVMNQPDNGSLIQAVNCRPELRITAKQGGHKSELVRPMVQRRALAIVTAIGAIGVPVKSVTRLTAEKKAIPLLAEAVIPEVGRPIRGTIQIVSTI